MVGKGKGKGVLGCCDPRVPKERQNDSPESSPLLDVLRPRLISMYFFYGRRVSSSPAKMTVAIELYYYTIILL